MNTASPGPLFLLAGRPKATPKCKRPDPLLHLVIEQCGEPHPRVAYLGSASEDDQDFFRMVSALLKNAGAGDVLLAPTAGARVNMGRTLDILKDADAILVSGGDVEEGMRVLGEKDLTPLLRAHYDNGTVFVGLSAGSIMLSRQWVRWRIPTTIRLPKSSPAWALRRYSAILTEKLKTGKSCSLYCELANKRRSDTESRGTQVCASPPKDAFLRWGSRCAGLLCVKAQSPESPTLRFKAGHDLFWKKKRKGVTHSMVRFAPSSPHSKKCPGADVLDSPRYTGLQDIQPAVCAAWRIDTALLISVSTKKMNQG